jgi:hypothetical protein
MIRRSAIRPALRGDRNQCPTCLELFNSTFAFDLHRTGPYGNPKQPRRCLSEVEMAAGMARNGSGYWVSRLREGAGRYPSTPPAPIEAETALPRAGNGIREAA